MLKAAAVDFLKVFFGFCIFFFIMLLMDGDLNKPDLWPVFLGASFVCGLITGILSLLTGKKNTSKFSAKDIDADLFCRALQDEKTTDLLILQKLGRNKDQLRNMPAAELLEALNQILALPDLVSSVKMDYPMPDPDVSKRPSFRETHDARHDLDPETAALLEIWIEKGAGALTPEKIVKLNKGLLEMLYAGALKQDRRFENVIYISLGVIVLLMLRQKENYFLSPAVYLGAPIGFVLWLIVRTVRKMKVKSLKK